MHLRLSFYKKLATAKNADQIDTLLEDLLVDNFGSSAAARPSIDVHRLRVLARPTALAKVDAAPEHHQHHVPAQSAGRPDEAHHPAHQEEQAHQAGRQRETAHRARTKEPRDRAQMVRDVLRSLGQPLVKETTPA